MYQIKDLNTQVIKGGFYYLINELEAHYIEQLFQAFETVYSEHLPKEEIDEVFSAFLNSRISDTTETITMMQELELLDFEFIHSNEKSYVKESEKIHQIHLQAYEFEEDDLFYNPYIFEDYL